jgi:hypothetical protein
MQQIAYDILSYLAKNPDAQDTLEGIMGCWLPEQAARPRIVAVEGALAELVGRGLVLERRGKDGRTFYKVNRRRLREISSLLAGGNGLDAADD